MIEMEDEEFLSQLAAAEAEAVASAATKRRKISQFTTTTTTTTTAVTAQNQNDVVQEGAYMAALKGSKSQLFHQLTSNPRNNINNNNNNVIKSINNSNFNSNLSYDNNQGGISGATSCYKCGKLGHWARDCGATGNDDVAEKECICKRGSCRVFTAQTVQNPGRKFYTCPVKKEDGGCNFFEWFDNPSGADGITFRSQTNAVNHSVPELPCQCGVGPCLILTAKTGKNIGQQFYKCPAGQGNCGFFKWFNDQSVTASVTSSVNTSQAYQNISNLNNKSYNASNFACFKCGKEGHWAKDCQQLSSSSPGDNIGKNASSGTCFKCGKPGHWAKDCIPTSETKPRYGK